MAVVNLGGGTGSFVSAEGLIITNHHVAFGAVQSLSSPEHNFIRDGFLARSRSEEIPAPGYNVKVMSGFENVTSRFHAALRPGLDPLKRYRLVEKISQELIRAGETIPGSECAVARFYGGREFYLVTYFKIRDMRVVYVPARSIGEYGGEVDNWMWPRHTGDFSFLRAYVGKDGRPADWASDNVPFRPLHHFPIAKTALRPGDFTMILGFPGTTKRWYTAAEVDSEVQANYPERIALLERYIGLLEKIFGRGRSGEDQERRRFERALQFDQEQPRHARRPAKGQGRRSQAGRGKAAGRVHRRPTRAAEKMRRSARRHPAPGRGGAGDQLREYRLQLDDPRLPPARLGADP